MEEYSHGSTSPKAGRVLTINSDPEVIRILEVNLKHANLEVISAHSASQLLSKINTEKPDIILLDPAIPDINGMDVCQCLKESPLTSNVPVILIGDNSQKIGKISRLEGSVIHHVSKPFEPTEVVNLVKMFLKNKERAKNVNPLTGLPNQSQVNDEISALIEQKKTFAAIYFVMNDLRSFNRVYGYAQGDQTIKLLANIISEAVRLFGNPDDFVGHPGGDKFVVLSSPWKARTVYRRVVADFNRRIKILYTDEHLQKGYVAYESTSGGEEHSPIMKLLVAVVTNQDKNFQHYLEVNETAGEQIDYLKSYPENECYPEVRTNIIETEVVTTHSGIPYFHREELKAIHGILSWLDFLIKEVNSPINEIKECLDSIEHIYIENLDFEQQNNLKIIREKVGQLIRVVEGITHLTRNEWLSVDAVFEEVHFGKTFDWIMEQLQELSEHREIKVDMDGIRGTSRISVDRKDLTQGLLYLLRGEIKSSPTRSRIYINSTEKSGEFVTINITNPNHYVPQQALSMLLNDRMEGVMNDALRNELYPAKLLFEGLGGKLSISSEKGTGITYTITVPKRWQSWMQEVDALRLATEISRQEARVELKNLQQLLLSAVEQMPQTMNESLEKVSSKVQELGVLCNRSLFLVDDINSKLENQQDRLLQQEAEQLNTSEALLNICREIAVSMKLERVFDPESAKRVAKYVFTISKEFKIPESDISALHHAALLKDFSLVLSPHKMVEQKIAGSLDEAVSIKDRFSPLWKILSTIPYLSSALVFILYKYDTFDDMKAPLDFQSDGIPLGSKILVVADAFDFMTSGQSPQGTLIPKLAIQKIVNNSGKRFDSTVINAFLRAWRRKEIVFASRQP